MAVIPKLITANTPVQRRWASFSNKSNINIAQAAKPRKISGHAYTSPALNWLTLN
jgi:hypothetical protein